MSGGRWAVTKGFDGRSPRRRSRQVTLRLGIVLVAILAVGSPSGAVADAEAGVRKGVTELSSVERQQYVAAVLALKSTPSPYDAQYSWYDQFVVWHQALSRCDPADPLADHRMAGHAGPVFLPWHRELLLLFEDALLRVSGRSIMVPYWDWTDARSTAAVYRDDFMGGDGAAEADYAVISGPFRRGRWALTVHPIGSEWRSSASPHLTRHLGSLPGVSLPAPGEVDRLFDRPVYDVAPFDDRSDSTRSFRNALEGWPQRLPTGELACPPEGQLAAVPVLAGHRMHNAVHLWAGGNVTNPGQGVALGTVSVVETSPNDPVFWLIHSNVDRLWAQWQRRYGTDTYQPTAGVAHNNADDVMQPFDAHGIRVTPRDVSDISVLGYRYSGATTGAISSSGAPRASMTSPVASSRWSQMSCEL